MIDLINNRYFLKGIRIVKHLNFKREETETILFYFQAVTNLVDKDGTTFNKITKLELEWENLRFKIVDEFKPITHIPPKIKNNFNKQLSFLLKNENTTNDWENFFGLKYSSFTPTVRFLNKRPTFIFFSDEQIEESHINWYLKEKVIQHGIDGNCKADVIIVNREHLHLIVDKIETPLIGKKLFYFYASDK